MTKFIRPSIDSLYVVINGVKHVLHSNDAVNIEAVVRVVRRSHKKLYHTVALHPYTCVESIDMITATSRITWCYDSAKTADADYSRILQFGSDAEQRPINPVVEKNITALTVHGN